MNSVKRIHLMGIGGVGMSGVAWILLEKGIPVSGSDIAPSPRTKRLEKKGAEIFYGHSPENLKNVGLVIISSAITEDNPELRAARKRKIQVWHRSNMLGEILSDGHGICVAGTHGKTTTSGMLSLILETADLDPTVLIGSEMDAFNGNAKFGCGGLIVAEADESDGSFLNYQPEYALITNLEAEHMSHYESEASLQKAFRDFLSQVKTSGSALLCADDPGLRNILDIEPPCRVAFYSLKIPLADYYGGEICLHPLSSTFNAYARGRKLGRVELPVPGKHNVSNAVAAIGMAHQLGVKFEHIRKGLSLFHGTRRRFQIKGRRNGITVIDDYAHHPTEVAATLRAALPLKASQKGRIITIFQPHRYSRTLEMAELFSGAFYDSDIVIITDVYAAGERPIEGVSGKNVFDALTMGGHPNVIYVPQLKDVPEKIEHLVVPGDIIFTMGAGDVWKTGESLLIRLGILCTESLK